MLKVKSFKLSDDQGVNELLTNYRLAEGASIFVSEGDIMVPYEDGEPKNEKQKAIDIAVQVNEMKEKIETIIHSNKVVDYMTESLKEQLDEATADFKSAPNNKKFEERKNKLEQMIRDNDMQILQNNHEIDRLKLNIKLFTE